MKTKKHLPPLPNRWQLGVKSAGSNRVMPTEEMGQTSRGMVEDLLRGDSRRQGEACLSDLQLDQLALGEWAGTRAEQAQEHLAQCSACAAAHNLLVSDRNQFHAQVNVASVTARILEQASRSPKDESQDTQQSSPSIRGRLQRWVQVLAWPSAASAVAALALIYFVRPLAVPHDVAQGVRAKGANISLSTYVRFAGQDQ